MRKGVDASTSSIPAKRRFSSADVSVGAKSGSTQTVKKRRHETGPAELGNKLSRCDLNDNFSFDAKRAKLKGTNGEPKGISLTRSNEKDDAFQKVYERARLDRALLEQRRLEIPPSLMEMKSVPANPTNDVAQMCSICYLRPKEATFVHGNISHQVCCYPCAKAIFNQKRSCPVCRRMIEKITKLFCS